MAFLSSDGAGVVAAITARGGGGASPAPRRGPPAPCRSAHCAIHLRYAHKANRARNGRPTFPLLLNLFISLLILHLNFNVLHEILLTNTQIIRSWINQMSDD